MTMIYIVDSIMGSGKTTTMNKFINDTHATNIESMFVDGHDATKFLVVVTSLEQVEAYKKNCPNVEFYDPQMIEGRKLHHLRTLVKEGKNICTTHALFKMLTREIYNHLVAQNYTLIVDEVLECVSLFTDIKDTDRRMIFKQFVYVEEGSNRIRWNHKDYGDYDGRFSDVKALCDNGNLILYGDKVLLWEFPVDFLRCFKSVYILTYLFMGSPMSAYLRSEGLEFTMMTIQNRTLVDWLTHCDESEVKEKLRSLITVYDGPYNDIGKPMGRTNPFSAGWYSRQGPATFDKIKSNVLNWFRYDAKTHSRDNLWTTFKPHKTKLGGDGYAKGWQANNMKATNELRHKKSVAYLCNIFYLPIVKSFFESKGITVYQSVFALSEMIQFIWRSQIRDGQPITVYIPSERMRNLFLTWLNSNETVKLLKLEEGTT